MSPNPTQPSAAGVALAVPCYNERGRLQIEPFALAARETGLKVLFVDDGSTDGTADFIRKGIAGQKGLELLACPINRGKAAAVREGVLALAEQGQSSRWIGFWDADLSNPLEEVARMLAFHELEGGGFDAIWTSRVMRAGSTVRRTFKRHLFGRLFATLAGELLGVHAYDTQCGAKLFRREVVREVFQSPFLSRWIFDVEIYCRLGHARILEYPVKEWRDVPGSKISILRDSARVAADLFKISGKYGGKGASSKNP